MFDEITPAVQGRLADYSFVDKGDVAWGTGLQAMRFLPYTGARWYWKAAVQDMLDRQIVTWGDIKLSLTAAAHLPADTLRKAFETMESSLHTVLTFCDAEWDGCKYTPLAAIGMLNVAQSQAFTCKTSNCSEDASFAGTARKRPVKDPNGVAQALRDGLVFDYIQRVELKSWKSYRPLGQIALDMDLVHIAWAMDLAKNTAPLDKCLQSTSTALL